MANDSTRCRIFYCCGCGGICVCLLLLLFHAWFFGVVVVACMWFCHEVVYCWVCVCLVRVSLFPK